MAAVHDRFKDLRVVDSDEDSDAVPPPQDPPTVTQQETNGEEETADPQQEKHDSPSHQEDSFQIPETSVERPQYVSDGDSSEEEANEPGADAKGEAEVATEEAPEETEPAKEAAAAAEETAAEEVDQADQEPTPTPPAETTKEEKFTEKKEVTPEKPKKKKSASKKKTPEKSKSTTKTKKETPAKKEKKTEGKKKATTPKKTKPAEEEGHTGKKVATKPKKTATTEKKSRSATLQKEKPTKAGANPSGKNSTPAKAAKSSPKRTPRHKREMNSSRRSAPPANTDDKNRSQRLPEKSVTHTPKKRAPRQSSSPKQAQREPEPGRAMQSDDPVFVNIRGQRRASSTSSAYSIRPSVSGPFRLVAAGQQAPHFNTALEVALLEHYIDGLVRLPIGEIERVVSSVCAPLDQKPVMNYMKQLKQKREASGSLSARPAKRPASSPGKGWVSSSKIETSPAGVPVRRPVSQGANNRRRDVVGAEDRALENFRYTFGNEVRAVFLEEVAAACLNRRNRFYREQPRMVIERGIVVPDDVLVPIYIQVVNKLLYRMLGWTEQEAQKYSPDVVELIIDELPVPPHSENAQFAPSSPERSHNNNNTADAAPAEPLPEEQEVGDQESVESDRVSEPFA